MLESLASQSHAVSLRLESGQQQLRESTASLGRIRAKKAAVLTEVEVLQRRLAQLLHQSEELAAEEAAVEQRLCEEAEDFARVQVLGAKVRRQIRVYQCYQQGLAYLYDVRSSAEEGADDTTELLLSPIDTTTLRDGCTGKDLSFDHVIWRSPGGVGEEEEEEESRARVLAPVAEDVVSGYNYTLLLCCCDEDKAREEETPPSVAGGEPLCSSATLAEALLSTLIHQLFRTLSDGRAVEVDRYRVGCSVAAVREHELTDLLGGDGMAETRRSDLLAPLPGLDGRGTRKTDAPRHPSAMATVVRVGSAEEVVDLARQGLHVGGVSGLPDPHLLVQLRVETFSVEEDYRQSILRVFFLRSPCSIITNNNAATAAADAAWCALYSDYLEDAAVLCAESASEALTGSRATAAAPAVHWEASAFARRLASLPSRARLARFLAPLLDPLFGENCKGLCVAIAPNPRRDAAQAVLNAVRRLLYCVSRFHAHARHAATRFVIAAEVLATSCEVEAVVMGGGGDNDGDGDGGSRRQTDLTPQRAL